MELSVGQTRTFVPFKGRILLSHAAVLLFIPEVSMLLFAMPIIGLVGLIVGGVSLIPEGLSPGEKMWAYLLVAALVLAVAMAPIVVTVVVLMLRTSKDTQSIEVTREGVRQRRGKRETFCAWCEIQRITTRSLGLIQRATIHFAGGKIRFEGGMIDAKGPNPKHRLSLAGGYMEFPDGSKQSLKIGENDLYRLIVDHAPRAAGMG